MDRLRGKGKPANPLNLIRFVPAEGLDASRRASIPFNNDKGGADAHDLPVLLLTLACAIAALPLPQKNSPSIPMRASPPNGAPARRWKKRSRPNAAAIWNSSRVADGVALLNRVRLEGESTKADIVLGLDTNLTEDAKATGLFAPADIDLAAVKVPGGWSDDTFVPFDYAHFAVVYDTETTDDAAEEPEGTGRGRSRGEDRHRGSAHLDAGPRAGPLGQGGLRRQGAAGLGEAQGPRSDRDARLERSLRPVHQGRGADGVLLHDVARLPHGCRGHRTLSGGGLRGRPLPADRGGRHDQERRQESARAPSS